MQVLNEGCVIRTQFFEIMNCKETNKYLEEVKIDTNTNLPDEIKNHIQRCASCRQMVEFELKINSFITHIKTIKADDFFDQRLMTKIDKLNSIQTVRYNTNFRISRVAAIALLVISSLSAGVLAGKFSINAYKNQAYNNFDELSSAIQFNSSDISFDLVNSLDNEN